MVDVNFNLRRYAMGEEEEGEECVRRAAEVGPGNYCSPRRTMPRRVTS